MTKYIWTTFEKEGIHCYPAALTDPALESVSFLGHPHRHSFKFKVKIEVHTDDRCIEFIIFKRWLESLYSENVLSLNSKSCEMMANDLFNKVSEKYPGRKMIIDVSEDGESGATLEYV